LHDFRRSAVLNMERVGVPRSAAMLLTGHKTQSIYDRYAIADHRAMDHAAEKLGEALGQSLARGEPETASEKAG
jgi:hypothetical protein